jgi:hypothetical protein
MSIGHFQKPLSRFDEFEKCYKKNFGLSAYFDSADFGSAQSPQHTAIRRILRYTAATFNMVQFRQGLIPPFECRPGMTNALLQNPIQEGICGKSQSRNVGYAPSICLVTSTPLSPALRRIELSRNIKQVFGSGL